MRDQRAAIRETDPDYLLICDAGRADVFESLYAEYLDGDAERVHNGGCLNTPAWFAHHYPDRHDAMLFHGGQPIRSIPRGDYDERDHFAHVPYTTLYDSDELDTCPPASVNDVVRAHLPDRLEVANRLHALGYAPADLAGEFETYVVRYLQPHKPYRTLPETASDARPSGRSPDAVWAAYRDNYRWVLGGVADLVADLSGTVVVTSDHGECLGDCGQRFHGPRNEAHDHLVEVPWLVMQD